MHGTWNCAREPTESPEPVANRGPEPTEDARERTERSEPMASGTPERATDNVVARNGTSALLRPIGRTSDGFDLFML